MKIKLLFSVFAIIAFLTLTATHSNTPSCHPEPFSILNHFDHSGYMGCHDGVLAVQNFNAGFDHVHCLKITASATCDNLFWTGVYFQHPADNWCKEKGVDLSRKGFSKITFQARGLNGGEEIKFKAGNENCDSFTTSKLKKHLTKEWQTFTIDLAGKDLSNVTSPFCWLVDFKSVGNEITFYLDNIQFE